MKKALFISLILWLLAGINLAQEESPKVELPTAARRVLDKKYPGWKFPEVNDEIRQYYKKSDAELNLVQGDFDGNGQADYALQIAHGVVFDNGGRAYPQIHLVALLQKSGKFKLYIVDADGGGDFLIVWKKGDQGYSYDTQSHFIFANDAIEAVIFEKAGVSYVFEKGKFRAIVTGD
jgi:hypothetical protein